jgi:trigger factor
MENLEHSAVKLSVTVEQQALKGEYDELLGKYSKSAHIKGFRKGKAPAEVIERKFGEGIKQEAAANIIEKSLKQIFEEVDKKPLPYVTPTLEDELDPDLDKDFTFTVTYDTFPEVELGTYKEIEIEEPQVEVTKEDEERELSDLQERNAIVIDKPDGTVAKDDIITIDYAEVDEKDEEIEGTKREGFVFTVGSGYNLYKLDDDVIGMKKDETKVIEKEFPEDFEAEELRGQKKRIRVTVTAVKQKQLPELDDELAQDIHDDYETLEDLKQDIHKKLHEAAESKVREKKVSQLIDAIVENSTIDLPKGMVDAELENSWQNFLTRSRIPAEDAEKILAAQGKSREDLYEEWRPASEKRLKTRLLLTKIIEEENIEVADNEVEEELEKHAEQQGTSADELREQYEKANYLGYIEDDIKDRKVIDFLLENAKIKKGEKVKFLDIMQDEQ